MMLPTFSGLHIDPLNYTEACVNVHDIAHGLAFTCRWAGQPRFHYSVAQHSCLLAMAVPRLMVQAGLITSQEEYDTIGAVCLLHDAPEYIIHDLTHDFKRQMRDYAPVEDHIGNVIFDHFGLNYEDVERIKAYDVAISVNEEQTLFANPRRRNTWGLPGVAITSWTMEEAEAEFLMLFTQLVEGVYDRKKAH